MSAKESQSDSEYLLSFHSLQVFSTIICHSNKIDTSTTGVFYEIEIEIEICPAIQRYLFLLISEDIRQNCQIIFRNLKQFPLSFENPLFLEWKTSLPDIFTVLFVVVFLWAQYVAFISFAFFLQIYAIASPSSYPCQWVGQSVDQWLIVSDLEIAVASCFTGKYKF